MASCLPKGVLHVRMTMFLLVGERNGTNKVTLRLPVQGDITAKSGALNDKCYVHYVLLLPEHMGYCGAICGKPMGAARCRRAMNAMLRAKSK